MNFDFSDDQRMLRDHARRFLSETSDFHTLRKVLSDGQGYGQTQWQQVLEQGWQGVAIGEEQGGLGLGMLELCVLAEELGRAVAPIPFFNTVCLGAELLKRCPQTSGDLLQRLIAGEVILAVALVTPGQAWEVTPFNFTDGRISGSSGPLAYGAQADFAILPVRQAGESALALVNLQQAQRTPLASFDSTVPFARIRLESQPATLLANGEQARQIMSRVVDQAAVLTAFEQLGGAEHALEIARDYALERHTFGRVIGSYQAVKHKLADMAVKVELARSNAYYGAWALQAGSDEQLAAAAALARISASEAYSYAAQECLHLHGGIGYTWEADCHFFYKHARLLAATLGDSDAWIDRLLSDSALQALHS